MQVSQFVVNTPPSGIRKMFNRIAEQKDVISLALGEPDFDTPAPAVEAACRSFGLGETHYTPNAGLYELRGAIARQYAPGRFCPEQVIVTAGATEALMLTMLALLNPGDEILLASPYWPTYLGQITAFGAVPRFVPTREEDGFALKPGDVEAAITPRARMLLINSPANPTGAVIGGTDLEQLAELAKRHDLIVVSDEVYRRVLFEGAFRSIADLPDMAERTIVLNSFSKTYAMTGWRVGYAIAPQPVAQAMESIHEYSVSCIGAPVQRGAIKALEEGEPYVERMVEEFRLRRDLMAGGIRAIPGLTCRVPPATFYLYLNISETGLDSEEFAYKLLEQEQVAVSPGSAFGQGQDGYIRLACSNSRGMLEEGLARMERFVRRARS